MSSQVTVTTYWKYAKWWHRLLRRKTYYHRWESSYMKFDHKRTWHKITKTEWLQENPS